MGLGISRLNSGSYLGGVDNLSINGSSDLKATENKLTEFLNSTGFVSSGIQDYNNFVNNL